MKLLMIPFEDHFNNLINVLKLTFISVLFMNHLFISASGSEQLFDYSLDASTKTCTNVEIHLTNEAKQGVLHSPSYYSKSDALITKCRWILNAPTNFKIDLTLIDFVEPDSQTNEKCLNKFVIKQEILESTTTASLNATYEEENSLWISVQNDSNLFQRLEFNNNQLNSCSFNLKPFTKIESNLNKIFIEYETIEPNQFNFLILFSANELNLDLVKNEDLCNNLNEELKCQTEYDLNQHMTCLPKNLLCNCDLFINRTESASKCHHLVQNFNDTSLLKEEINCYYFLKLNNMCQNQNMLSRLINDNEDQDLPLLKPADVNLSNNDYDLNEAASSDEKSIKLFKNEKKMLNTDSYCLNQTFSNEYGWIASPSFATRKTYAANLNCYYHIAFQPNQIVQLRVKHFMIGSNLIDLTAGSQFSLDNSISIVNVKNKRNSFSPLMPDTDDLNNNRNSIKPNNRIFNDNSKKPLPFAVGRTIDYDYLSIYDGSTTDAPLLSHLTSAHNDFNRNFNGRVINSKSNHLLIVFHTAKSPLIASKINKKLKQEQEVQMGFNLTYQIKGFCIEDQLSCNSVYELNCYSKNQTCNDVWDCHNGADERGCGPCKDQFRCRNHIFCYRLEDRCDGDHQCIDKSDELNCDPWFCNSENGTFLCNNGRCVYEQWVCDGANDCDDGSDEINCPTPFTRRVITTAVLGGTLCCLLLVMALGCACKLYSLHTVGYRNNIRLSQSVQSAAAAAAASVPLISSSYNSSPPAPTALSTAAASIPNTTSQTAASSPPAESNNLTSNTSTGSLLYNNLATLFRRALTTSTNTATSSISLNNSSVNTTNPTTCETPQVQTNITNAQPGELPTPHFLIAPPTYNQTMGLVDEYEQRQLAFIEHVRSILLAQQQNQQQTGLINLNPGTANNNNPIIGSSIPTATSSSTILHRVTSSGRRSHSSRHHRHHHHNRSSSTNVDTIISNQLSSNNSDSTSGARVSHSRRHHHHHRHRTHNNCANLASGISSSSGANHHQISNSLSQVNFDSNRRGLIIHQEPSSTSISSAASTALNQGTGTRTLQQQLQRRRSCGVSSSITSSLGLPISFNSAQSDQLPMIPTSSCQASNLNSTEPGSAASNNNPSSFNTMVNKSQSNSINLRDRIAKLIKDIVVHHGDNIQYVQLADQVNSSTTNTQSNNSSVNSVESISIINSTNETNNQTTTTQQSTSSNISHNGSEDDVPLIQP